MQFWSSVILGKYATTAAICAHYGLFWSSVILGKYATSAFALPKFGVFWSSVILGKYATIRLPKGEKRGFGAASFWVSTQPFLPGSR